MDKNFLNDQILTIAKFRGRMILRQKERSYYSAFVRKLQGEIRWNVRGPAEDHIDIARNICIDFEYRELARCRDTLFTRQSKMIKLAVADCLDAVEAQKRWEGGGSDVYPRTA